MWSLFPWESMCKIIGARYWETSHWFKYSIFSYEFLALLLRCLYKNPGKQLANQCSNKGFGRTPSIHLSWKFLFTAMLFVIIHFSHCKITETTSDVWICQTKGHVSLSTSLKVKNYLFDKLNKIVFPNQTCKKLSVKKNISPVGWQLTLPSGIWFTEQ